MKFIFQDALKEEGDTEEFIIKDHLSWVVNKAVSSQPVELQIYRGTKPQLNICPTSLAYTFNDDYPFVGIESITITGTRLTPNDTLLNYAKSLFRKHNKQAPPELCSVRNLEGKVENFIDSPAYDMLATTGGNTFKYRDEARTSHCDTIFLSEDGVDDGFNPGFLASIRLEQA